MKRRIIEVSLLVFLLAGCEQVADTRVDTAAVPAPAAEAPPEPASTTATTVPDDVEAGVDPSVWDNEGEPEGETPGAEITCEQEPLATHFFTLVGGNSVDNCGRTDPKVLAAFDALMAGASQAESPDTEVPPLRDRLLSGPSAPGQPMEVEGKTWWYYSACQAHQCNTNQLVMLYEPTQSTLVGRLVTQCKLQWLGEPTATQRALLDTRSPVDPALLSDDLPCE
ncbi:Ivy family c-type lysozyme inhibitor [Stenotrophomonas sp. Iso1]|uniref:Ivy family c-type lysozyme inhibitor n=1 Tax=Stenotrophomonas sp. Iso1 TaxID=2977283 RepID=UPI0022B7C05F|nr:Ivy family c-type lysozyme inhibitor [Stenotrophomonas sp. Iso1]